MIHHWWCDVTVRLAACVAAFGSKMLDHDARLTEHSSQLISFKQVTIALSCMPARHAACQLGGYTWCRLKDLFIYSFMASQIHVFVYGITEV